MSSIIYSSFNGAKSEVISSNLYGLSMKEGFEIIFLTIITYFVLKYKYFKLIFQINSIEKYFFFFNYDLADI